MAEDKKSTGTLLQLYLALVWLGTSLYTAWATIKGSGEPTGALGEAASALPGVIASTLVTGAGIGSAASSRFNSALGRGLAGVGMGAAFGLVTALGIRWAYGPGESIMVLAITVGIASVLGGALAVLPNDVLEAALWATTWVFFAGVILGVLQTAGVNVLAGSPTADAAAKAEATTRFIYGGSVLTGLMGGFYASRSLNSEKRSLLWYVVAGGLPGGLLVLAEWLTRLGGQSLVDLVNGFSADDPALNGLVDAARLRHGLIVVVVGVVIALIGGVRANARITREEAEEARQEAEEARLEAEEARREAEEEAREAEEAARAQAARHWEQSQHPNWQQSPPPSRSQW